MLIKLTKSLVIVLSSLVTRCSIKNIYIQTFALKWSPSLPVCIRLHFNESPYPLRANVIIEWPHLSWLVPFFAKKIYVQKKTQRKQNQNNVNEIHSEPVGLLISFIGAYNSNTRKLKFEKWTKIRHFVGKTWPLNH